MAPPPLTLGTAGHIDHGKTALVRALTGVDTDRLPEEKARGISIALGYAPLELPSGRRLSVVDVPGHERFVRTMVAGATGIDLYLMVVAADDGVMPQTREHAAVLAALGVEVGVVALTKADVADPGRARSEAAALLPGVEAVAVSAREATRAAAASSAARSSASPEPVRAETGTTAAPPKSGSSGGSATSVFVTATTPSPTPSACSTAQCSRVCGITPSSAATTSRNRSIPVAPATIVRTKRSWPGTSTTDRRRPDGRSRAA